MARKELMGWQTSQKRWFKKYRGKMFAVSCRQLGVPQTKDGSLLAANIWWEAKQAELDAQPVCPIRQAKEVHQTYQKMAQWHIANGDKEQAAMVLDESAESGATGYSDDPLARLPESAKELWQDRFAALDNNEEGVTIKQAAIRFMERQKTRVKAKEIVPLRYEVIRNQVDYFCKFIGAAKSVAKINTENVDRFYNHILEQLAERKANKSKGISPEYADQRLGIAVTFTKYCVMMFDIPLPKNLIDSRYLKIKSPKTKNVVLTAEQVKAVLGKVTGRNRLCVLLMLNCGMYPADISSLKHDEINWKSGRITRKRTKTEDEKNAPRVCHKLWPETIQLLKQHRSKHDTLVLVNEDGTALQKTYINDKGRGVKVCNIQCEFNRLRLGFSLNKLRKTSGSLIYNNKEFRNLSRLFLAQSPFGVQESNYVEPDATILDEALDWLGNQYGLL